MANQEAKTTEAGSQPMTTAAQDYFERYERTRGPGDPEERAGSSPEYWLSEEEEESHQLQRQKGKRRKRHGPAVAQEAKGPKLRPAEGTEWDCGLRTASLINRRLEMFTDFFSLDVLKRLRWDSDLDVAHYVVGYVERFDGVKEMPAAKWIKESTDEDFIPQHRIKYFKRITDGEVVWDRDARIDRIFGSGLTSNEADDTADTEGPRSQG